MTDETGLIVIALEFPDPDQLWPVEQVEILIEKFTVRAEMQEQKDQELL